MNIQIAHLFPDLMNLYGDWGNVAMVRRTLEAMGHSVTVTKVQPGDAVSLKQMDFIYMGAGTESASLFALEQLRTHREALLQAYRSGTPMVFCGTALDVLGTTITDLQGISHEGLCLLNFTVKHQPRRKVEDVVGETPLTYRPVVGYRNTCSTISGDHKPFLPHVTLGTGETEGILEGNLLASQLTGPLLVKNPEVLRWVVEAILKPKGVAVETVPLDPQALAGHAVTLQALNQRK